MKKREKINPFFLASTALFLYLIIFSSFALATNNRNAAYQSKYEEAIKACDKAIEINTQDSNAWLNKGDYLLAIGNLTEAEKAYDKAIKINPQDSYAWLSKGTCLVAMCNYTEAIKIFDKVIEIDPHRLDVWVDKGVCFAKLGNYTEAINDYDKAIEINSQNSDAWFNKGLALGYLDNYEEAIKAFDKVIESDSQNSDAWYNKGRSLECLGNYEEAIKAFDKVIESDSQDSYAWYNKGTCLAHLGSYEEAVKALDKAIEIDPHNLEAVALKESILSNSNGLMTSLKSFFSNNDNIFVGEDDLLEYAETYTKTYEDIIKKSDKSNLTNDDLKSFSFYQGYPYSVNATVSNIHGASIEFIPNSIQENKATRTSHPIEELIPKVITDDRNNTLLMTSVFITGPNATITDLHIQDSFIYVQNSTDIGLYQCICPIILAKRACFNGITYINSNQLFRVGEITINGTLIINNPKLLNNSKVILKSNLKKDWTKEKAEEDAIDSIYKEQINRIFDYSKLTGLGFYEIKQLVTDYNEKESTGYYETHNVEKMNDRTTIIRKADQYNIPHDSFLTDLLNNKQQESSSDKIYSFIDRISTVGSFILLILGIFGWFKRREIVQKLKSIFRYLNNTFRRF
jgi:tetratricopeptide (TPR) repeat protein